MSDKLHILCTLRQDLANALIYGEYCSGTLFRHCRKNRKVNALQPLQ
jgi:hypothetical protein